ncbi:mitochondrial calcium uniporter regulator 1 isoform X2 [Elgaria multicarinata webbii]|uniref:mitochondrial calcium uniporter regulator 1 isoform X2 n=1 Tax=Elgaria multicarinata webbii TaxID=159646 RepID=UPI002FCCBF38
MVRGQAAAVVLGNGRKGLCLLQREPGADLLPSGASRYAAVRSPLSRRCCLGDWKRAGFLAPRAGGLDRNGGTSAAAAAAAAARGSSCCTDNACSFGVGTRFLSLNVGRCRAVEKLGFTTQQSEVVVSALMNIMKSNMDVIYKDMVTKIQQEIALQQIMSRIGVVKKDMIILEKSEFSALRAENEKLNLELRQLKKQVMDETSKVRTDSKLDFNLEKSRVKELYSLNERKLLKMKTEVVELHAQQDRALTQTDRKIDTEVAGMKTMLESHKLDNIKYLAGSVFTCLTVALGFYRLWI